MTINRPSNATKAKTPDKAAWTLLEDDEYGKIGIKKSSSIGVFLAPHTCLHCLLLVMAAFFEITMSIRISDCIHEETHLSSVDELGQRNVCVVAKDVVFVERTGSAILELDAEEVAKVGRWSSAQFDGNSRGVVGYDTQMNA